MSGYEVDVEDETFPEIDEMATQLAFTVTGSAFSDHEATLLAASPSPDLEQDVANKDGLDIFLSQHQAASHDMEDLPAFKLLATMEAEVRAGTYRRSCQKDSHSQALVSHGAVALSSMPSSPLRDRGRSVPKCFEPKRGEEVPPPAAAPNVYRGYSGKPIIRGHYGICSGTRASAHHPCLSSRRTHALFCPGPVVDSEVVSRRSKHVPMEYGASPRILQNGAQWELQPPKTGPVRPHELRMEHSALRGVPIEKRERGPGFMARWLGSETERIGREVRRPVGQLGAFVHQGGAAHSDFLGAPLVRDGFVIAK